MVSVLFVCLGNICRSPMAEAVFRHYVQQEGLSEQIKVDSAGTYSGHIGQPPHRGTQQILQEHQIDYNGIVAQPVREKALEDYTYIIGMDNQNVRDLSELAGEQIQNIYRFVDFIPNTTYQEVPDPYYTGDFQETYQLVTAGCRNLLEKIKKEHNLE
jgi:protein-tyrosine phosphatase